MSNKVLRLSFLLALTALFVAPLQAGNPLIVDSNARVLVWGTFPIQVIYDQGTLGNLSNSQAVSLVQQIFTRWQSTATAQLSFQNAGSISHDIATKADLDSFRSCTAPSELLGKFAVIFDTDGSITDGVFGSGQKSQILGFASPRCLTQNQQTGQIFFNAATAVLNGYVLTTSPPVSTSNYQAVIMHEVGHALGLDHTQLNASLRNSSSSADRAAVPLMYPFLTSGKPDPIALTLDDSSEISLLYPSASFSTQPSLTGTVFLGDGVTPFQGGNVVARNVSNLNVQAEANVSGDRFTRSGEQPPLNGSTDTQYKGKYEFFGLPAGNYQITVETIESRFTSGSSVGPLDPPFPLPYTTPIYGPVAVSAGSISTQNLNLGQSNALPSLANLTIIPHFAIGGGYVTRVLIKNTSSSANNVIIQFMNQNGSVASNQPQQSLAAGQAIQVSSGEANRNSTLSIQWIAIGSDQALVASVVFDCCAATTVTTATGVLGVSTAGTRFTSPFLFQQQNANQPILTEGMAIADRSGQTNTVTVQLLDANAVVVASDTLQIGALNQTAFDPSSSSSTPTIKNYLASQTTFFGSVVISSAQQFVPMIVGNLGGRLFSLPLVAQ